MKRAGKIKEKRSAGTRALAVLAAAVLMLLCACGGAQEAPAPEFIPSFSGEYPVFFAGVDTGAAVRLWGTRPYTDPEALREGMGLERKEPGELLFPPETYEGREYISLADAALLYGLDVYFTDDGTVEVLKLAGPVWPVPEELGSAEAPCYIRLEDIMADEGANGRFTHENLRKLRVMASYLHAVSDGYYIAWIPSYADPVRSVYNDISRDVSYYNADFVYTLDLMSARGGMIGLHGLTHQKKKEVSADGYEFGKRCGLSAKEVEQKYEDALAIADRLGYEVFFWEFPHYEATKKQADLAAKHFGLIYQCHPDHRNDRALDRRMYGDREVIFLPTPADYVYSEYDKDGILERLAQLKGDDARSLFMHPSMDYGRISVEVRGDAAVYHYEENGILPAVIKAMAEGGYRFSAAK